MEITLVQAVLIGLFTAICNMAGHMGLFTGRALIFSFGVGVILGDIPTALTCGATAELAFMGFGTSGGTVPPNPIGPGVIGTIMAITIPEVTPESALSLSIPFAVAIQFLTTTTYVVCSGLHESGINALKKKNFFAFQVVSNVTLIALGVMGFLLGFLGAYSIDFLTSIVSLVPAWLLNGLTIAGGMLPAIGFAMIMSIMLKKELIPFVLLGYILVAFFQLPVIGVALVGCVFALKTYNESNNKTLNNGNGKGAEQDDWI